jgi:hypothetical protein
MIPDFHALFVYEPDTGNLRRRKSTGPTAREGDIAGCIQHNSIRVHVNGKSYPAHHIIWYMTYGVMPTIIDHIDGNFYNNKLDNLRDTDIRGNGQNRWTHRAGRLPGANQNPSGNWVAKIRIDGKYLNLGTYPTEKRAHAVYHAACTLHKYNQGVYI